MHKRILILIAVVSLLGGLAPPVQALPDRGGRSPVWSVRRAVAICRSNPGVRLVLSVHGYFFASRSALGAGGYSYAKGGLFPTAHVPNTPRGAITPWAFGGRWKSYGALFLIVRGVIPRGEGIHDRGWLTAHGTLDCRTYTLTADRNPFPPGLPLPSGGGGVIQTSNVRSATKNGVRLTASVHADSYPRNALVSVWIGLRNLSHHTIYIPGACRGPSNPHVSVLNGQGQAVFPPLIPVTPPSGPPIAACKAALPRPLKPGQALHWRQNAVLRGGRILAFVGLSSGPRGFLASQWRSVTVPVRLTAPDAPDATVIPQPPVQVRISGGGGTGPYLVSDWWSCPDVMPVNGVANRYLFSVRDHIIEPSCAHPTQWHGVVGRLGHSLARFDYSASEATPTASTGTAKPWVVREVLNVPEVGDLCASHASDHFITSVRGYLESSALQGPAGGWVGRLFVAPNPHAFFAGDTKPFVEVWGTVRWPFALSGHQVTFHGLLACDAATYRENLAGWLGSLRPDRFARAAGGTPLSVRAAVAFCQANPAAQKRLAVRGWFVPTVSAYDYIDGGLFPSRHAVPPGPPDWDIDGKWVQVGALLAHIATRASFGDLNLTLHGVLDCSTFQFTSDRDPFPPPHLTPSYGAIHRGRSGPITEWAQAGGLRLSITVPRRAYPLNALARVTVSIQNVSHHSVGYLLNGVSPPGVMTPQAQVLGTDGQILFPPVMADMPPIPGPTSSVQPLLPGKTIAVHEDIIVRGPLIRAAQPFTPHWPARVHRALNTLTTHAVRVHLTTEPAPVLSIQQTAQGPVIDVTPPPGMHGEPLLISYADCGVTDNGPRYTYISVWTPTVLHITPGCAPSGPGMSALAGATTRSRNWTIRDDRGGTGRYISERR